MELKKVIESYNSFNEQEEKDKELMLKYIDSFDDVLTRDNEFGHFVGGGFVVNKTRDKILMVFHNKFNSWALPGGHADGENNILEVALREVKEETGIKDVKPIVDDIISLDILPIAGHIRKEQFISSHVHLSLSYLFEADETEELVICEEENSSVKWISIDQMIAQESYLFMKDVYKKIIAKIKEYNL